MDNNNKHTITLGESKKKNRFNSGQETLIYSSDSQPINSIESHKDNGSSTIDLGDLWRIIKKRMLMIFTISTLIFIVSIIITASIEPIYKANATIQINPEDSKKVVDYDVNSPRKFRRDNKDFYQTQYELLKSQALARKVIDKLYLDKEGDKGNINKPIIYKIFEEIRRNMGLSVAKGKLGKKPIELSFLENLTIKPLNNSRIFSIEYKANDPEVAAKIINTLMDEFIKINLNRKIESASYAENILKNQLNKAKSRLQYSESKLIKYAKKKGMVTFDGNDSDKKTLSSESLREINRGLAVAEKERIETESKYKQTTLANEATSVQSNTLIQNLKETKARVQVDYQEKLNIYKPAYPLMLQLNKRIKELDVEIAKEIKLAKETVRNTLKSNFLAAKQKEDEMRKQLASQKRKHMSFKDNSVKYNTLNREVEINQQLYQELLQRMKEVSIASSISTNTKNISIIDAATTPYAKQTPDVKMNLLIGLILGLGLGIGLAFLLDFLNDKIKSIKEVEQLKYLPILGKIPFIKNKKISGSRLDNDFLTFNDSQPSMAESIRSLRTNLLLSSGDGIPNILQITSSIPSEGKTNIIINLAIALCKINKTVLIIDCDIRKPSIHKRLGISNNKGLSDYLNNHIDIKAATLSTTTKGLFIITAGRSSANPTELLSDKKMLDLLKLARTKFDTVLIDSPPVMDFSDALILSNYSDATLFLIAQQKAKKKVIIDAYEHLKQAKANILGTIYISDDDNYDKLSLEYKSHKKCSVFHRLMMKIRNKPM